MTKVIESPPLELEQSPRWSIGSTFIVPSNLCPAARSTLRARGTHAQLLLRGTGCEIQISQLSM